MAVNETITLNGVPQVTEQLAKVQAESVKTSQAINAIGTEAAAGAGIQNFFVQMGNASESMNKATRSSNDLRLATRALKPVMGDLGVSMGPLGGLVRLAAANLGFLAASLGGLFLISIEKAGDEIASLHRQINLLVGEEAGAKAFDNLKKSADELKTSVSGLVPIFQDLVNAQQRSQTGFRTITGFGPGGQAIVARGLPQDLEKQQQAVNLLIKAMQQVVGISPAATDAVAKFIHAITQFDPKTKDAIGLTREEFIKLQDEAPALAKALEQSIGPNLWDRLQAGPISYKEIIKGIVAHKDLWANLTPPDTLPGQLAAVGNAWHNLLVSLSDIGAFSIVSKLLKALAVAVDALAAFLKKSSELPPQSAEDITQQITGVPGLKPGEATAAPKLTPEQAQAQAALKDLSININRINDDFSNLHTSSGQLKAIYDDQGTSMILAGVGMTNLAASVQKASDASATFAQRFDAVNDALQKSSFVSAPGAGQFGVPPGSKTVGGGLGGGFVSAPGGAGALTAEQLVATGRTSFQSHIGTLPEDATAMPHVFFDALEEQAKQAGADAARIYSESFASADFTDITQGLNQTFDTVGQTAAQTIQNDFADLNFSEIGTDWSTALQSLVSNAQAAWNNIQSIFSQPLPAPSFGSSTFPGGFPLAAGGLVFGPGTGTSDSIPARLSAGEFIMTAAATRHWGASFLAALNNLTIPRSTLIPRFAEGGPVSAPPAAVHLHFGGESFALQASEGVATALRRHAVRSRLVSTGRKPSWY